jgi:hypothetical protein
MPGGGFTPSENSGEGQPGSGSGRRPGGRQGGPGGFGGMGSSDVKLQYVDDEIDSYSNIWSNAKTDITQADQKRLIASLKKLSENENIEDVVDVEQVIRYFVVHNFVCNGDSYTGGMIHNYYLYEKDGKMAMIPWDYNLAFGTFQGSDATGTINTPIDSPVSGGSSDRPMLNWIFENEEYTELYHQYFAEFLDTVDIVGIIDAAYKIIAPYVEKDPTSFYTYEEFEKGVDVLRKFCELRAESIRLQLENGETTENMGYVDASDINLSDMGSMNNGGPQGGRGGGFGGGFPGGGFPGGPGRSGSGGRPDGMPGTQMPGNFGTVTPDAAEKAPESSEVNTPAEGGETAVPEETACADPSCAAETPQAASGFPMQGQPPSFGGGMTPPGGRSFDPMGGAGSGIDYEKIGIMLGASLLVLAAGLIVAKKFKVY